MRTAKDLKPTHRADGNCRLGRRSFTELATLGTSVACELGYVVATDSTSAAAHASVHHNRDDQSARADCHACHSCRPQQDIQREAEPARVERNYTGNRRVGGGVAMVRDIPPVLDAW